MIEETLSSSLELLIHQVLLYLLIILLFFMIDVFVLLIFEAFSLLV